MTVRLELSLVVEGDGPTETAMREHCAAIRAMKYTAEYHDLIAQMALMLARMEWRDADQIRARAADHARRSAARRSSTLRSSTPPPEEPDAPRQPVQP
jgi:hypothetical protein